MCQGMWQTLQVGVRFLFPNTEPESEAFVLAPVPSGEAGAALEGCVDDGVGLTVELFAGLGSKGFGHFMSAARFDLQCIRTVCSRTNTTVWQGLVLECELALADF